ncbi:MAG: hypothetical protein ACI9E1_000800 [Cryomorphaceae bacterium]
MIICGYFAIVYIRSKIRGTRIIRTPNEFLHPLTPRPLSKGLELIVGYEDEFDGEQIVRHSISPECSGEQLGAILRVNSANKFYLELKKLSSSP